MIVQVIVSIVASILVGAWVAWSIPNKEYKVAVFVAVTNILNVLLLIVILLNMIYDKMK